MFISKLILHRCKRFYLKGIETFEANPTMKTQIILGTNGSGKSSLLKVGFHVMPADRNDFLKDGYKLVHVLNNGHRYELLTDFSSKAPSHSFVIFRGGSCDGEELNVGKTGAVQRELIREHFNMSADLLNVLTGQLRFTDMSAIQRREWIALLSSANFDYIIGLHGKVKRAVRDTSAVIKYQAGRLVQEGAKKIDPETYAALRKQSQDICDKLMELHQQSRRSDVIYSEAELKQLYDEITFNLERLLARSKQLKDLGVHPTLTPDIDVLSELKDNMVARVNMLSAALQEISEQHQDIDRQLYQMNELKDIDVAAIRQQVEEGEKQINSLLNTISEDVRSKQLPLGNYCINAIDQLCQLIHGLVHDEDSDLISRSAVNAKRNELSDLQTRLMNGTARISELTYRLEHISNCSSTTCPKCSHVFKEGVNTDEESEIKQLLDKGQAFKSKITTQINAVNDWLNDSMIATNAISEVESLMNSHPELVELWVKIKDAGGLAKGRGLIPTIMQFRRDLVNHCSIHEIKKIITPMIDQLAKVDSLDGSLHLRELANSMAERVVNLKELLLEAKRSLDDVNEYRERVIECNAIRSASETLTERLEDISSKMIERMVNEEVANQVRRNQASLGAIEQTLAEAEIQMGIINDLNKALKDAEDEERALILLEKSLSPKDGVIAEQIIVFINTFISGINDVISKVWGYNLALDACSIDDGGLDYKFPIYVHNSDNYIEDVKFGSDSQVDIINQAFRLVTYKFMELQGFPLFLDELGRTFDEVHRLNLTLALKELMDDDTYSQVFLITHSFESQNSYPNSQIIVLDDTHVSLKREFNEHVKIS